MIIDLHRVRQYLISAQGCEIEAERHDERTAKRLRRYAAMQRQRAEEISAGRRSA